MAQQAPPSLSFTSQKLHDPSRDPSQIGQILPFRLLPYIREKVLIMNKTLIDMVVFVRETPKL